jgi:hypothetical protein
VDEAAEGLPHDFLDRFCSVPDGLEYLCWEGKQRVLYQIQRSATGEIRAVECKPVRVPLNDDWNEARVLDYEDT